ncbi:MAG: hypothetical protein JWP36_2872 [Paucimonas sp.]|nr:hypothetical protein [Paucimonas sp.]
MNDSDPAPASPCVNICRMDAGSGLCEGCLRTLDEIAAWGSASNAERRAVLQAVQARRQALALANPGRESKTT